MRKYRCIKAFSVPKYDKDGYRTGEQVNVEPGMEFTKNGMLFLADPPAVRLEAADGTWIEIYPDKLEEHFEEVTE